MGGVRLTALGGLLIRAVLAVIVSVTHPLLGDTVAGVTLEAAALACVVAHWRRWREGERERMHKKCTIFKEPIFNTVWPLCFTLCSWYFSFN